MALSLQELGRMDEAKHCFDQALSIRVKALGEQVRYLAGTVLRCRILVQMVILVNKP